MWLNLALAIVLLISAGFAIYCNHIGDKESNTCQWYNTLSPYIHLIISLATIYTVWSWYSKTGGYSSF